jgi:hypothetical protein
MKFDLNIVLNVLIAVAIFYALDKIILEDKVTPKLQELIK